MYVTRSYSAVRINTILGVPIWSLVDRFVDWISLFGLKIENYLLRR